LVPEWLAVPTSNRCRKNSYSLSLSFAELLNISPDSPDAQIFKEYAQKHESKNGTAAPGAQAAGKQRQHFAYRKLFQLLAVNTVDI
jgi:hypothetical protein